MLEPMFDQMLFQTVNVRLRNTAFRGFLSDFREGGGLGSEGGGMARDSVATNKVIINLSKRGL